MAVRRAVCTNRRRARTSAHLVELGRGQIHRRGAVVVVLLREVAQRVVHLALGGAQVGHLRLEPADRVLACRDELLVRAHKRPDHVEEASAVHWPPLRLPVGASRSMSPPWPGGGRMPESWAAYHNGRGTHVERRPPRLLLGPAMPCALLCCWAEAHVRTVHAPRDTTARGSGPVLDLDGAGRMRFAECIVRIVAVRHVGLRRSARRRPLEEQPERVGARCVHVDLHRCR